MIFYIIKRQDIAEKKKSTQFIMKKVLNILVYVKPFDEKVI